MSRTCLLGVVSLLAAGAASQAMAAACEFKSTVMLGETQPLEIHECWDLGGWPADKAQSFCRDHLSQDGAETRVVAACPAAETSGQCKATFRSPSAAAMPAAYFAQMPKEMADQIKARMNANNPLAAYDGLPTTVHYYSPKPPQTLADQKADCVQAKKGQFTPRP